MERNGASGRTPDGASGGPEAAAALALIEAQQARVVTELDVDARLLYGAWGTAWLLGFGALAAASGVDPLLPVGRGVALVALFVLLAGAMVLTGVQVARATRGVRGPSGTSGAMYGGAWLLAFASLPVVMAGVERIGAPTQVLDLLWTTLPCLLVGALYVMGAAVWQDKLQFGLGAWIIVVTGLGSLAGLPAMYVVMSLAGGGGFLVAALWFAIRGRASPSV